MIFFTPKVLHSSFFILHSSLNFAKQNSFGRAASQLPRRAFGTCGLLASGYPLHHLRRVPRLRWFRYYPSRLRAFGAPKLIQLKIRTLLLLTNANNELNGFLGVFAPDVETGHALSLQ
jgi:hypothetical protein